MAGGITSTSRAELARFLRARRARLQPAEVGLPDLGRRRTPGLRRQEVAQLAGMSVDYYVRLEQARGPRPSRQILGALARAFMLTADEREYLFRIAGEALDVPIAGPSREVPSGTLNLMHAMTHNPAYVLDAKYELLAWNRMATYFLGDPGEAGYERNVIRTIFARADDDPHWGSEQTRRFAQASVADLRAAMGRYPGDQGIAALITELLATSGRFREIWAAHQVELRRNMVKRVVHPQLGPLELDCQVLYIADTDQRVIVYTASPGSRTAQAFAELAARAAAAAIS